MERHCTGSETDVAGSQAPRMTWHPPRQCARFVSCHKTAMNRILLINAEWAKAFVDCPGLVGHVEVFVAAWLVWRRKRRALANDHGPVIQQKKQQKDPTFGQTKPALRVGSVSVEGLFCESEAHRRRVDSCPLAHECVPRPNPSGD